jgi:hypothetical protein
MEQEIKGIERNSPRSVSDEVSTWEILNLRPVRNGWRPVGRKPVEITGVTGLALHVHVMDTVRNLISIHDSMLYFKNLDDGTTKTITEIEGELLDVNHLEGVLIVATTVRKYEFIYQWDSKEYKLFPDLKNLPLGIGTGSETKTFNETDAALTAAYKRYHLENRMAGKTEGFMILRYVVELTDGTYIYPSRPVEIGLSNANSYSGNPNATGVAWLVVQFPQELKDALVNHKDTVAGIAIFGTTPRSFYKEVEGETYFAASSNTPSNIIDKETFNLLKRFSISEIIDAGSTSVSILPNYETLNTQEALIIEDDRMHEMFHKTSYIYNGRLLTGDITTMLSDGWILETMKPPPPEVTTYGVAFVFEIETSFGLRWVRTISRANSNSGIAQALRLISYPDIRAKKVYIYIVNGGAGTYSRTLLLKPHSTQNFAYAFLTDYNIVTQDSYQRDWETLLPSSEPNPGPHPVNKIFTDPNRVQVSEINNPLVMPYKNSYQVGNSNILGFAVNGVPVSEGQFGQYPVYTFTGEGIYMMDIGVDPFISSIRQINGEICNSPKTVKNIGVGVLFTTDKGLMIINSLQVNSLSVDFEQEQHNDYAVRHNPLYQKAIALAELGKPDRFVSTVPFMDYIINSNIGFDYPNREIWVNNPAYPYSYVYSIDYQVWSKRDETFTTIVDNYPRYYAQQGRNCKNLSAREGTQNMNIFLLSNPVKIRFDEFKQFRRMVARGEFPVECMGVYLFGSVDGFSWAYVGGKEIVAPKVILPVPKIKPTNKTDETFRYAERGQDGRLYFCGGGGGIWFLDDDGEIKPTNKTSETFHHAAIGQDGRLYFCCPINGGIWFLDDDGSIKKTNAPNHPFTHAAMGQDGRLYFCAIANGGIWFLDDDGEIKQTNKTTGYFVFAAMGQDNRLYFCAPNDDGIWFLDDDGEIKPTNKTDETFRYAKRGQDGRLYFCAPNGGGIWFLDDDGEIKPTNQATLPFYTAAMGQDNRLYFCVGGGGIWFLDDDGEIKPTDETNFNANAAAIGQDNRLYFCGQGIMFLDNDGEIKPTDKADGIFAHAAIGQDGRLYFCGDGVWYLDDGTAKVVKAKDAIYLGAHKSVKYAAVVIEGVVTHEWNLTHISETAESVTNKKLR